MKEPYFLEKNTSPDPFVQFDTWFKDVCTHKDISYEEMNAGKILSFLIDFTFFSVRINLRVRIFLQF